MSDPAAAERAPVPIEHFSDVLCVWAYCAQARLDEVRRAFGERVAVRYRLIPVFGSTARKIGGGWADRGGFSGYARHVASVAQRFPHVTLHPDAWERVRPASSGAVHAFLKAVQRLEAAGAGGTSPGGGLFERASWATRLAFFAEARDVGARAVQMQLAEELGVERGPIERALDDGSAMAALFEDIDAQAALKVEGSPTLVFNEGRQKLYGNVGYRIIEANLEELLRAPDPHAASWC